MHSGVDQPCLCKKEQSNQILWIQVGIRTVANLVEIIKIVKPARETEKNPWRRPKIKGELDALGYNVYLIGSPYQADMYTTTTKAITDYIRKECGAAMRTLVISGREQRLVKPRQPIPRNRED